MFAHKEDAREVYIESFPPRFEIKFFGPSIRCNRGGCIHEVCHAP